MNTFTGVKKTDILELLVFDGKLDAASAERVRTLRRETRRSIPDILIDEKLVDEKTVYMAVARQYGLEFVSLAFHEPSPEIFSVVPVSLARAGKFVPLKVEGEEITVAIADPTDVFAIQSLKSRTGLRPRVVVAEKSEIERFLARLAALQAAGAREVALNLTKFKTPELDRIIQSVNQLADDTASGQMKEDSEGNTVRLVEALIELAVKERASDIHFELDDGGGRVRFRIDGDLVDRVRFNSRVHESVVLRLKVLGKLDITERLIPQDGHFKQMVEGREVDFRLAILPSARGENAVVRVLDRHAVPLNLDALGMNSRELERYRMFLRKSSGIILVTGPTGSGKTTTLYSSLLERNDGRTKIITVEDPVEFELEGIHQMQVFSNRNDPARSITFAGGLRAVLRQDPDVIMIGEIRDLETAMIAINAGLTGHLVFSTIHANRAFEVPLRIRNLGLEPHHFTDTVLVILAQRLVKLICSECIERVFDLQKEMARLGLSFSEKIDRAWKGVGCRACNGSGYRGRTGIYELMPMTDELKKLVARNVSVAVLREKAVLEGMTTLLEAAREKVREGRTTLEEYCRIATSELDE